MKKEVKRTTKFIVCMSALFCCLFFAGTVSKASQVQPTVTPSPRRVPLTRVLLRSGIYTYQVTNEKEKKAAIRYIETVGEKLEIPSYIDGYRVETVGIPYRGDDMRMHGVYGGDEYTIIRSGKEKLKEVTIPEGVRYVGEGAFADCSNLRKLNLPSNPITLGADAFSCCKSLTHFVFRNYTTIYDWALGEGNIDEIVMPYTVSDDRNGYVFNDDTRVKRVYIPKTEAKFIYLSVFRVQRCIKEVIVDGKLNNLIFPRPVKRWTMVIDKVVVNYKGTKLEYNEDSDAAATKKLTFKSIYTVSGAKAISFARAHKATYYVKKTGETQVVKGKKVTEGYKASWKKVKTKVTTNQYKTAKKKWSKSTKAVKTVYQVYGKKTKAEKYQFIKTTKSRKLVSKYKYVKAVPKETW